MGVSSFARFKGGFDMPRMEDGPEALERVLEQPATYLATELGSAGIRCSDPEWCDFEYEIQCSVAGRQYQLSVSFDYINWEWFEIGYPPTLGLLARLLGRDETSEMTKLSNAVDTALRRREGVTDLRWYRKPLGNPEKDFAQHPEDVPS